MRHTIIVISIAVLSASGCAHNKSSRLDPGGYCEITCKSGYKGFVNVSDEGEIRFLYSGPNERVLEVRCDEAKTQMMERTVDNKDWHQHISWCTGTNCIHTTISKKGSVTRQIIDRDGDGKADEDEICEQIGAR